MPPFKLMNREEINRTKLSNLNFNQVCNYLDDSLDRDWNIKVPNHEIPFKAFCRTNYGNKHLIETCIMVEGDINGSEILTGVVSRFYFRNYEYNFNINKTDSKIISNDNNYMQFAIVDNKSNLQYMDGNDERFNTILKEYRRLVNPLEIKKLTGKVDIIGYDLYNFSNPSYNNRTALEMLHDIYRLEEEYLEIFDNL